MAEEINMKRTLIIFGIVLLIVLLGIGVVWFGTQAPSTTGTGTDVSPRSFLPFGSLSDFFTNTTTTPTPSATGTSPTTEDVTVSVRDTLKTQPARALVDVPVASATFVETTNGTTTEEHLRYVERNTGHVSDVALDSGITTRVSNTTVPRIEEALWGDNGTLLALRYLDADGETIETFLGRIDAENAGLPGSFLPKNIRTIALHPTEPKVFYLLDTGTGVVGRLYDAEKNTTVALFSSPLSEWAASWNAGSFIFLSTKPSTQSAGIAFVLNPQTGAATRVLTGTQTLLGLPGPSGSVLFGFRESSTPRIGLFDPNTRETTTLSGNTLPEKCTWLDTTEVACALPEDTTGNIPDAWYEGSQSFNDGMWVIDTKKNLTDFLFDARDTGEEFDATHLVANSDGTLVAFVNKKDSRLWIAQTGMGGEQEENF